MFQSVRALFVACLVVLYGAGEAVALSEEENGVYLNAAIAATQDQAWDKATALAEVITDPVASDIITWMRLRSGADNWQEYIDFIAKNPSWPGLGLLRNKGEAAIPANAPPAKVIAYFKGHRPQTGEGILRLIEAYRTTGKTDLAKKEAIRAWRSFSMVKETRKALFKMYKQTLAPYHIARLDMLLWRNLQSQAEGLYSLVPKGYPELAKARLGLRKRVKGVNRLINAVPKALKDDAGLAYERFVWRARKDNYESARDLLIARSTSAKKLGRPDLWADRRRSMARKEMRDGNYKRAYKIAVHHFLTKGSNYADLEWLAGYIALRKLNEPALALKHFNRFRAEIGTPISFGRAGYWQGRAYDALGDRKSAKLAYEFAAGYQTSFYGQLAAEKISAAPDTSLNGREDSPNWRSAGFVDNVLVRAALLLHYADDAALSEKFFRKLSEGLDRTGLQQLADLSMEIGRPNIALRISKQAAREGFILPRTYFPLTDLAKKKLKVAPELALSIARRESEMDQFIISPAGARGLMQLMPATARKVAKKLGMPYSRSRLTSDWEYNVTLGSSYLADQIEAFNGSYILAFAAYNAGPSRAKKWIKLYGDPRLDSVDQVDWIESIPFRETRNYVMRVMESVYVYRARLKGHAPKLTISKDLKKG
ncbi:MAG: lytic transglycosylase domain-containing protein [Alphaproteobacteria bacterium]|nr:lytic transglycosylase domain-containing protein [Alphaproteobacteria bacterium]